MIKGLNTSDMISISKSAERTEARLEKSLALIAELQDKLTRRNMQIRELKKKSEKYLEILRKNGYIGD